MKVGIHIDRSVEEIEVLITAQERNRKVDALYQINILWNLIKVDLKH